MYEPIPAPAIYTLETCRLMRAASSPSLQIVVQTHVVLIPDLPIAAPQEPCDVSVLKLRSHLANKRFYVGPDGEVSKQAFLRTFAVRTRRFTSMNKVHRG